MKKGGLFLLLVLATQLANCTGELPISDLINNTITLKLLGTYESNDPYGQLATLPKDDIFSAFSGSSPSLTGTDLDTYGTSLATQPSKLKYYIDIAEVRIANGQGKSSSQSISDYWKQFAIDRQLMCSSYDTAESGRILQNCADQNGVQRLSDFFSGGFTYPAVDIPTGFFNNLGIYFRRFVSGPAAKFTSAGAYTDSASPETTVTAAFDNRVIYGLDIETLMQNQYGETATTPRMFPLQRFDLDINVNDDHEPYVLEVRVFIQNNMMVHALQPNDSSNTALVYVAPADWNINHAYTDSANDIKQGGALLMTARTYKPAKVGSIQMSAAATSGEYFGVTKSSVTLTTPNAIMPLAATRGTNTTITNLEPGSYNVYRLCDKTRCTSASTAGSCDNLTGTDGYPETVSQCTGGPYQVTEGSVTNVTTTNCNASCP